MKKRFFMGGLGVQAWFLAHFTRVTANLFGTSWINLRRTLTVQPGRTSEHECWLIRHDSTSGKITSLKSIKTWMSALHSLKCSLSECVSQQSRQTWIPSAHFSYFVGHFSSVWNLSQIFSPAGVYLRRLSYFTWNYIQVAFYKIWNTMLTTLQNFYYSS